MTTPKTTALSLLAVAILGSASACSEATGPDEDPGLEPPAPRLETVYDVTLVPRYVRISLIEACDGRDVFGNPSDGEFQYRVEGERNGARQEVLESDGYGSVSGRSHSRDPGEIINFANETWSFDNLRIGDQVGLRLRATEWDFSSRDDYLRNREEVTFINITVTTRAENDTDAELFLGASTCGMTLVYDRKVTSREVRVD